MDCLFPFIGCIYSAGLVAGILVRAVVTAGFHVHVVLLWSDDSISSADRTTEEFLNNTACVVIKDDINATTPVHVNVTFYLSVYSGKLSILIHTATDVSALIH